ncbi:MAG TPA: choice-of-anchor tandem repeat GloVer-containing protein [Candidatus Binatia bacterium]|nr:choice-of-anchor tandem repeat GloVer-containing protein [Candidatus Binatia bacterium]
MRRVGSAACIIILASCVRTSTVSPPLPAAQRVDSSTSIFQVLHIFKKRRDGIIPAGALLAVGGTLYGTTNFGGDPSKSCYPGNGCGTVFEMSSPSDLGVVYRFAGSTSGTRPYAGVIDVNGTLYGTTQTGGKHNQGTVFSLTPSGSEHVIHSFGGKNDGSDPRANLVSVNGALYGTTYYGGLTGTGTVFTIDSSGVERVLHNFQGGTDGSLPLCALIEANNTLYGTTSSGGANNAGTVFRITPDGASYSVLYTFRGGSDGAFPYTGLTELNGMLYGTTEEGGQYGEGTVFSVTATGSETVLHSFGYGSDGANPYAGLTVLNGQLYGTTAYGGSATRTSGHTKQIQNKPSSEGTIYTILPSGTEQVVHDFSGGPGGRAPYADLTVMNGALYGTTIWGGDTNNKRGGVGTVFEYSP